MPDQTASPNHTPTTITFTPSATATSLPRARFQTPFTISLLLTLLYIHVLYLHLWPVSPALRTPPSHSLISRPSGSPQARLPDLFIYRRSKKTASSSMVAALLTILPPLGYTPLNYWHDHMHIIVHNEYVRPRPRRLFISEHNLVKRSHHPTRHAVIADTFRDGYSQMTAFCRHMRKQRTCNSTAITNCLQSAAALHQRTYRWCGDTHESPDTYIDLPLSSAHVALSTSVLRTVFPGVVAHVQNFNVRNATCPFSQDIRTVYDAF